MLTAQESTRNLGKLRYGKANSFTFILKNEGNKDIKIDKVVVGCGSCTKATLNKTDLVPNEEVPLKVVFTPGSTGAQTKHITVRYEETKTLSLTFTAQVHA